MIIIRSIPHPSRSCTNHRGFFASWCLCPDASILHVGNPDTATNPDVRREPAGVGEVVIEVCEDIMRVSYCLSDPSLALISCTDLLSALIEYRRRTIIAAYCSGLIIVRLPIKVFQFHAKTAQRGCSGFCFAKL